MRAVSTSWRGTRAVLSAVATTMGDTAPMNTRNRAAPSPSPNHTRAMGSQAVMGTERTAWKRGSTAADIQRDRPRPSPRGRPTQTAMV